MRAIMLMKLRGIASRQPPHYSSPIAPSSGSSWELLDEREMSLASDGVAAATACAAVGGGGGGGFA